MLIHFFFAGKRRKEKRRLASSPQKETPMGEFSPVATGEEGYAPSPAQAFGKA